MEAVSTIEKIRKILFGEEPTEVEVPKEDEPKSTFMDATLEDGTLLNIEPAFEVGAAVVVIDADGNVKPAEDSTHTLASGEVFTTVDGIITEIAEMESEEVVEEEVPMAEAPTETQEQKVKKVVESIVKESHFAKEESIEALRNEFAEKLAEAKEEIKNTMFEAFTKFSQEPIKEETKKVKPSFSQVNKKNNFFKNK